MEKVHFEWMYIEKVHFELMYKQKCVYDVPTDPNISPL